MSSSTGPADGMKDLEVINDVNSSTTTTVELLIPAEAVGRMIGTKGVHIKMLKQKRNITKVVIKEISANSHALIVTGDIDAVTEVVNLAQKVINSARTTLDSKSRAVHSWKPKDSGSILTPREVHKTGYSKPKVGSVRYDKEKQRIKEIRKEWSLAQVDPPNHRPTKLSNKQRREKEAAFELGREQFEAIKAAREEKSANNKEQQLTQCLSVSAANASAVLSASATVPVPVPSSAPVCLLSLVPDGIDEVEENEDDDDARTGKDHA